MHIGWLCAALSALASLPSAAVFAATPDPALRRSEHLDARRLGKVSDGERSVLRVEWRAALSGEEEARSVQEMLDSLRRTEETVAEISRLLRGIPVQKPVAAAVAAEPPKSDSPGHKPVVAAVAAEPPKSDSPGHKPVVAAVAAEPPKPGSPVQKPVVAAVTAEPPESDSPVQKPVVAAVAAEPPKSDSPVRKPVVAAVAAEPAKSDSHGSRLLVANIATGCLVALWWFRRRNSAKYSKAVPSTAPEADPPVAAPLTIMPAMAAPVATTPAKAPIVATPAIAPSAAPAHVAPAAEPRREAARLEPRIANEAIKTAPVPTPVTVPAVAQTALPKRAEVKPLAPPPAAEALAIDFSLDEADPESVARANARVPKPRASASPSVTEIPQETNVEPTLQLAEIMLSMGLEQGAAQALLEYTETNPRQAVYHWLKLLGIYRKRGLQTEFTETAEKLRKHFNVQAEDWVRADTGETPTLEKFPRVAEQVQKTWLQPAECLSYLRHLLEDNRDGARAGFPQAVAEEILLLIEILKGTSDAGQTVGL